MGNSQSPASDPRFTAATRTFSAQELDDLRALFMSLASQSNSEGQFVTPSSFKAYFGLRDPLGGRLFHLVTQKRGDERLTFEDLVIAKGTYEKGTKNEIEEFIYELLDVNNDGIVGRSDIEDAVNTMLDDILSPKSPAPTVASHHDNVDILLNAATFAKHESGGPENQMSYEDFRSWCNFLPSVRKYLGSLLIISNAGRPRSDVPHLITMDNMDSNSVLLKKEYAWIICGCLPQHETEEWTLLYHSACNGLSFTTFLGNSSNYMGPTVLVIKDKEGYLYGGYASQPWERHGDFYGDMKSFVFQLHPKASIFRPTGANNNTQWCAANFSSDSIPNGVGFGGRIHHFGLFLSASFDQGHTFSCTTFGSPCLSKTTQINPDVIECWAVLPKESGKERPDAAKGTILERFKEDRNMLNMVGIANASE
uniref:Uncharacterized protein n=1 Tax=Kalanchoe fedtschenkoi TaxID=63787 RepID=A0A7N0SWM1_KALFE